MGITKASRNKEQRANSVWQRTLKSSVSCVGVGLHSGKPASLTLQPAAIDAGIVFKRTDIGGAAIPAKWDHVVDSRMCTTIGDGNGVAIGTVEHLMAALAGCGIDNAVVEVDGPEVPIMDGSAQPFVAMVATAGVVNQDAPRQVIRVLKTVSVETGNSQARLSPGSCLSLDVAIDFASGAVAKQSLSIGVVNGSFARELAGARTFGFLHEVEKLWAAGLAKGGSLDNAVVVSGDKVLNQEGLRFDDEFVRHKILDAVGDLYLAGAPIIGNFHGVRSGHATNNALLKALFTDSRCWKYDLLRGDETLSAIDGDIFPELAETA
ncbi:MAG: UDP-3-O-acyl-N-acetylglucosamine deacetylase [Rhodospirillales bacterium]|nr:UDP-3-O-acyl-N-acetylglucosamine deacetylase [Rhodospirillales bacterium]